MDCSTPGFPVHHRLPEFTQTHVHWVGDAIQPSHPLSSPSPSYLNHFSPASGSFLMSQFFASGGQCIGVSASTSVLTMNVQDWFPLGLTSLTSLQSKGLSRVFSNTTVQKHQFFGAQVSYSPTLWLDGSLLANQCLCFLIYCLGCSYLSFQEASIFLISWLQSPSEGILESQKMKSLTVSTVSPSICHEVMGPDAMFLVFWILNFKSTFSLFSFIFIKGLFSSSLSSIRVVSSLS